MAKPNENEVLTMTGITVSRKAGHGIWRLKHMGWFDWSVYPQRAHYNFQPEDFLLP